MMIGWPSRSVSRAAKIRDTRIGRTACRKADDPADRPYRIVERPRGLRQDVAGRGGHKELQNLATTKVHDGLSWHPGIPLRRIAARWGARLSVSFALLRAASVFSLRIC
jgi:hypothetical protein